MDTAKCAGVGCPIRDGCDRFVRPAVDGQRWIEPTIIRAWQIGKGDPPSICLDRKPIIVQPHGGAREEVDGS